MISQFKLTDNGNQCALCRQTLMKDVAITTKDIWQFIPRRSGSVHPYRCHLYGVLDIVVVEDFSGSEGIWCWQAHCIPPCLLIRLVWKHSATLEIERIWCACVGYEGFVLESILSLRPALRFGFRPALRFGLIGVFHYTMVNYFCEMIRLIYIL